MPGSAPPCGPTSWTRAPTSRWSWRTPTRTSPSAASPTTSPAKSPNGAIWPTAPSPTWRQRACGCGWTPPPGASTCPAASSWSPPPAAGEELLSYDKLIVGTGAVPVRPPISGLTGPDALGPADGVHLLHSMGDTFGVMQTLEQATPSTAIVVGAGYIGLEMADALTVRGLAVAQMEQLPEVLPTVDPQLGALVHAELAAHGVEGVTRAQPSRPSQSLAGRNRAAARPGHCG